MTWHFWRWTNTGKPGSPPYFEKKGFEHDISTEPWLGVFDTGGWYTIGEWGGVLLVVARSTRDNTVEFMLGVRDDNP